ncbi:MAG: hypothetical protein N2578_06785 [Bdellovibrionaceae bacterium]|nr:hypothetical protein [Pseudobdellovibrionaceae bacterium]
MTPRELDFIFPFVVFFYGFFVLLVLENPALVRIGQERMPEALLRLKANKPLAWGSFFLGGLWVIQNMWFQ